MTLAITRPIEQNTKYKDKDKDTDKYKYKYKDKDKVQVGSNMCYIFEKPRAQGCQYDILIIMTKKTTKTNTKTKTQKKTNTLKKTGKGQKRPYMCHIFEKQMAQGYQL